MRTIGLIGGLSWESTQPYYRIINEAVRARLGGLHSAKLVLFSVDFAEIADYQHAGDWAACGQILSDAARSLRAAGAECVALCTNTMHKLAGEVETTAGLPLLHIADATAATVKAAGMNRVGLLGTRFTMEEDFYRGRLRERHGIEVLVPDEEERAFVHRVIYEELCLGDVRETSRCAYQKIVHGLVARGAQGVVLGCTEVPMLLQQQHAEVPLFDTAIIHARYIAEWALRA